MPCGIELRSLEQSRAESAECGFSSVAKNKITVMDDRRDEQG